LTKSSATDYATIWAAAAGGASVHVGATAPASPNVGDLWWRNDPDGVLFVYYADPNSSQWVPATPTTKGDPGPAGQSTSVIDYRFSTSTTAPPASGYVLLNSATASAATVLSASNTTNANNDVTLGLNAVTVGSTVFLQDKTDATRLAKYTVTALP